MLKNILNLEGAQQLSKMDQKEINGGLKVYKSCEDPGAVCPEGTYCVGYDNLGKIMCQ